MQTERKKVMHKGQHVGDVDVPVYETIDELLASEENSRILSMFNKQNRIRIMGNERVKHTGERAGKKKRARIAFSVLTDEELASVARDYSALEILLNSEDVQARVDEQLAMMEDATAVS